MRLFRTEWKKIIYSRGILTLSILSIAVILLIVPFLFKTKNRINHFGIMQAYYTENQVEPSLMPNDATININNTIGYILGMNNWKHPQKFEIYRTALFATFIFVIIYIVFVAGEFSKEYERHTLRYDVFCGYGKLNVLFSKFIVLNVIMGFAYLISVVFMGVFASYLSGFHFTIFDIYSLTIIVLKNIFSIMVYESATIFGVIITKHSIWPIVVNVIWFFSSFLFYPMLHVDNLYYGPGAYIFTLFSPGTYLYRNCSMIEGQNCFSALYLVILYIFFWSFIILKLRKQEV